MLHELIERNRSYRRFHEDVAIERRTLEELVDLARLSASAANRQPLKYVLACDGARNAKIFPCLKWAGYLPDWAGPVAGERPAAYIVILGDSTLATDFGCDHGIAAQSIMLGAAERELGGCMIGSVDRDRLRRVLALPPRFDILLVLALGAPKERVVLETVGPEGDIRYWRDAKGVHHVPKRRLEDVVMG